MGSRISDLLLHQGDIEASRAQNRGAGWANVAQTLGQVPSMLGQMRSQQAAAQQEAADRDVDRRFKESQIEARALEISDRIRQTATEEQARQSAAQSKATMGILSEFQALTPEQQRASWPQVQQRLRTEAGWEANRIPAAYPGGGWARSMAAALLPLDKAFDFVFKEPEPPKTREIRTRNADGSEAIQIVEDAPGFSATSAAPVKEPKTYPVTVPGLNGQPMNKLATEDEMRAGVPGYRAPTAPRAPVAQQWVVRNGQPTPIQPGTAQPGDLPYDAVAARSGGGTKDDDLRATQRQRATDGIAIIDSLIQFNPDGSVKSTDPGLDRAFGAIQGHPWVPDMRQGTVDAAAAADRLLALVTLPEMQSLRGLGPASDRDVAIVQSGASTIKNRRIGDTAVRAEMKRMREAFVRLQAASAASTSSVVNLAPGADAGMPPGQQAPTNRPPTAGVSVRTPDGQTFSFPNQQQADQFKRRAGIP